MNRRTILLLVVIAVAALLAYLMRDAIEQRILQPLIFFFWVLGVYYRSLPQALIWIILVVLIVMIEVQSFASEGRLSEGRHDSQEAASGRRGNSGRLVPPRPAWSILQMASRAEAGQALA